MAELPESVHAFLNNLASSHRHPAYLLSDAEGRLVSWGGSTESYGLSPLETGAPVGEQVYFLEGLLPLASGALSLPFVHTNSGRPADLHLFPTPEGDCALLLDATIQEQQQRMMQQKGNDLSLSYQRLVKEIQKKEILLHCIVHDLAGPLMGIKGGFELLASEPISESGRKFLQIGLRQAGKQETLIREILQAFSAEIASLDNFHVDAENAPNAATSAAEVIEALTAAFALNQVHLRLDPDLDRSRDWKVVGEKSRLDRVISNLVENALRHSPANATVTVGCYDENDKVLIAIDDEGPGIPPEIAPTLFQKFAQGKKGRGKIGLGLYFCRITVEHWGGEIGHTHREHGGTRFWFRLPRPSSSR
ncbi:MAG: HAMP domain-containing sensor histidine kinase [Blastocatellia bacterium]|nr:HAMP domain-containing sensor histidine kinase [Blastocatellia bacterium]